jgi:hypothetical protein
VHAEVPGDSCTSGEEREFTLEERWYAGEEMQAGAARNAAAAEGSGDCEPKDHTIMVWLNAEKPTRYQFTSGRTSPDPAPRVESGVRSLW